MQRTFRKFIFAAFAGGLVFFATMQAGAALIDWAKHEEWRRNQMEALLEEIKEKGSVRYAVMSFQNFDTNKDGAIDVSESQAIKDELAKTAVAPKK